MKKIHKKILGFFGLAVVVVITAVAVFMPTPTTQATSSMTDTITVKVINSAPEVALSGIENGKRVTAPGQKITVQYRDAIKITVALNYTNIDGQKTTYTLDEFAKNYEEGEATYAIPNYGYGTYQVTVRGEGYEGTWDSDAIEYTYYAVYAEGTEKDKKQYIDIYYGDENNPGKTDEISRIEVRIYDKDGNEVPFSPITVMPPTTEIELPLDKYGLSDGTYTVKVTAFDKEDKQLGAPYIFTVTYKSTNRIETPDTGGLFQGTNISKTDCLVTGLVIFGLVAMTGALFILQRDRKKN